MARLPCIIFAAVILSYAAPAFAQVEAVGSRPGYIYDDAGVISDEYHEIIDTYLRGLDDATTNEVVIYTIPSFEGHGITKDGTEIQDRDMLANYIYNEVELNGVKGIGKEGKDNGVLVLMSLERDAGGGSLRIEVGRGLEGDITDGTAGQILDRYLVSARTEYEETGGIEQFDKAFLNTAVALGTQTGYIVDENNVPIPADDYVPEEDYSWIIPVVFIIAVVGLGIAFGGKGRRGAETRRLVLWRECRRLRRRLGWRRWRFWRRWRRRRGRWRLRRRGRGALKVISGCL
ncbi:TPM domain-containing protein [Candidatus Nitrososphaera sp. FF02]|uniref:TPM domain-containing protein n=1 Tax=Candidatus Nitrososphaera sp. FF02 TaxID=3398226 RepID=UPI0039ED35D0